MAAVNRNLRLGMIAIYDKGNDEDTAESDFASKDDPSDEVADNRPDRRTREVAWRAPIREPRQPPRQTILYVPLGSHSLLRVIQIIALKRQAKTSSGLSLAGFDSWHRSHVPWKRTWFPKPSCGREGLTVGRQRSSLRLRVVSLPSPVREQFRFALLVAAAIVKYIEDRAAVRRGGKIETYESIGHSRIWRTWGPSLRRLSNVVSFVFNLQS
jgi:hypothetical protein